MRHTLIFDTAFGRCAVAWHDQGLTAVRLPDDEHHLRAALARHAPTAVAWPEAEPLPVWVANAVRDIRQLLAGQPQDLKHIPIDLRATGEFERRVYAAAQALPPGHTCTYGEMARALNEPAAMRAVGHALGSNPWPLVVPCHRITAAGGKLGGFSAPGGNDTKRRLLVLEAGMVRREGELF
jgi:methylated-DNA-[protein]-cysteine S-methyltransferase